MSKQTSQIYRYLTEDTVAHGLWHIDEIENLLREAEEAEQDPPILVIKTMIMDQVVQMLDRTGAVRNASKLGKMLMLREKRESTGLAHGVAIPHVRTDVMKEFAMCIILSSMPIPYESLDNQPVQIFVGMASPTYEDNVHLKVLSKLSGLLSYPTFREELLSTYTPGEVLHLFRREE